MSFFPVDHLRVGFKYFFHSFIDNLCVCVQYVFYRFFFYFGHLRVLGYLLHGLFRDFQDLGLFPCRVVEAAEEDSAWTGGQTEETIVTDW